MDSTDSETIHLPLLHNIHTDNQNNHGIIGHGSHNIVNSGNITIDMINDSEDELERMLGHHVSKDALRNSFHSPPECHPKTRTTIRNGIGDWVDESGSKKSPLLWLNGPAAVGKSVIAKTISGYDQVVAAFFFSMGSDRTAAMLIPTLAWQLARSIPDTKEHIIASLKNRPSLQTSQIEEQFDLLIIQPLKKVTTTLTSRPVMVIDGVDECTEEDMIVRFLLVLVKGSEGGDMPVRFIICSRPEPRIHAILGIVRDVNPTTNRQEPTMVSRSSKSRAVILSIVFILSIAFIVGAAFFASVIIPAIITNRLEAIILIPFVIMLAVFAKLAVIATIAEYVSYRPTSEIHRRRPFLQGASELYKSIQLGIDEDDTSPETASDGPADALDRICLHPVISTIPIGISEECKEDIARYLTDRLHAIHQPGESTSPRFQPSDISRLVEASSGQFLYASFIVRLINDPHFDPTDVFEMVRRGPLQTPDLDELYEAVLERAHDTSKRNGRRYQMKLRFLKELLAILVFLAGNAHFFTERKNLPVIEALLDLKGGKLALKLSKLHSVLRIAPEEKTIQAHHRSFLEFLQDRERSGEYHISQAYGLRRVLILITRAGFRFSKRFKLVPVQDMVTESHRNFFGRSRFPFILKVIHLSIHFSLMFVPYMWCFLPVANYTKFVRTETLSITFFFLTFSGTYIISLIIYAWYLNRSIVVPFFHPFLHPLFYFMGGFLFPKRLFLFLVAVMVVVFVLIPILGVGLSVS